MSTIQLPVIASVVQQSSEEGLMTKLPVTLASAGALEYAKDIILKFHTDVSETGSPFEAVHSRHHIGIFYRFLMQTYQGRMTVLSFARAGDPLSLALLRDVITETKLRGAVLQPDLEIFSLDLINGATFPPPTGSDARDLLSRDTMIALVVGMVADRYRKMKITGSSARRVSVCDVVSEALAIIGIARSPKRVAAIWRRYGHIVLPGGPYKGISSLFD
jgi:hypothetical protein